MRTQYLNTLTPAELHAERDLTVDELSSYCEADVARPSYRRLGAFLAAVDAELVRRAA